jgi:hypothetical protein
MSDTSIGLVEEEEENEENKRDKGAGRRKVLPYVDLLKLFPVPQKLNSPIEYDTKKKLKPSDSECTWSCCS